MEEPSSEPKESAPANLVSLKTQTASLRDQIYRLEKEEEWKGSSGSGGSGSGSRKTSQPGQIGNMFKSTEKFRKKLAEIEAQLVLASPSLLFQVGEKNDEF